LNRHVRRAISDIASDNRSGAAEILRRAARVFSLLDDANDANDPSAVVETCAAMIEAQPAMAPLANLASAVARAARARATLTPRAAADAALAFISDAERRAAETASHAARLVREGQTVLTHSRSSTVLAALNEARSHGRSFTVVATESRPMLEGRALAEHLSSQSISVTVIADAAAALMMDSVDVVLVGADRVTPDSVVNKIGTRMIALAALERGIPVYALSDSSKFINFSEPSSLEGERRSGDELWPQAPGQLVVANYYFEPTPLTYFTAIITEGGEVAPSEAARRAQAAALDQSLIEALSRSKREPRRGRRR
jgi:translation initiation factor 2B subunit (eIF-2B alpha/beta/delta family)